MKNTSITLCLVLAVVLFAFGFASIMFGQYSVNAAGSGSSVITLTEIQRLMFAVAAMLGGIFLALVAIFLRLQLRNPEK